MISKGFQAQMGAELYLEEVLNSHANFLYTIFYIYFACMGVWGSVCLYPINVKTAEPIGPKFFV